MRERTLVEIALDVDCPSCGAVAGVPCTRHPRVGVSESPDLLPTGRVHVVRADLAGYFGPEAQQHARKRAPAVPSPERAPAEGAE